MKTTKMLFRTLLLTVLLQLGHQYAAQSQNIVRDWVMAAEHPSLINVSYQVVQCSSTAPNEVHIRIFNESSSSRTIKFDVLITNPATNQSFTTTINKPMALASILSPDCAGNPASNDQKIALPAGYDPSAVTVGITFIP